MQQMLLRKKTDVRERCSRRVKYLQAACDQNMTIFSRALCGTGEGRHAAQEIDSTMRQRFEAVLGTTTCFALICVAGCAGGASEVAPPGGTQPQFTVALSGAVSPIPLRMRLAAPRIGRQKFFERAGGEGGGDLYVSQFSGTPVQEYHLHNKKNGPPLCSLGGKGVNGIAVDPSGNLWVPNGTGGGQGYTQEYAPNCGAAMLQITDNNGQPADVGFDGHKNIYILSIYGKSGAPGSVNVYNSAGTLLRSLSDPTFSELIGIATDSHNTVFVSNRESNGDADVVEFPRGKMPGTVLSAVTLGLPGAPQLDKSNNLIITDWEAFTLNVYAPPYTGPPAVTSMVGLSLWCPLDRKETLLYCADTSGSVDVYDYPSGKYAYSFTNGLSSSGFATGSAAAPAAPL
jgi:hypothetical protein